MFFRCRLSFVADLHKRADGCSERVIASSTAFGLSNRKSSQRKGGKNRPMLGSFFGSCQARLHPLDDRLDDVCEVARRELGRDAQELATRNTGKKTPAWAVERCQRRRPPLRLTG